MVDFMLTQDLVDVATQFANLVHFPTLVTLSLRGISRGRRLNKKSIGHNATSGGQFMH